LDERLRCVGCGEIHAGSGLVKTEDGRVVGSYSEEWRRHCEARWVFKKKRSKGTRQAYLEAIKERRGVEAYLALRQEMMVIWKHRQGRP